ncbi:hypothetical protein HPB47_025086 [Ixodes persulcatus]|uniref:Uncharacterized protein n=1 Tax=Ixodes persulcatus TaxID=34615 RepID=A0AC60Q4C7_IXOPE|nr:hypothetical protein HPB47_025086 [Ixodes persulcatus]
MEHLIVLYQEELKTHPAITQVLTIAALLAAGDVISQTFFQKKPFFDARQSVNFFIVGLLYTGSISVAWFGIVERLIVIDGFAAAVIKVLVRAPGFGDPTRMNILDVIVDGVTKRVTISQGELEAHPAITQVLTMATLLLAGDVVSQTFFQKKPFNTRQTANFFIVGVFYTGPCSVAWFGLVERFVVMDGVVAAVIKVLAGQVIYTPPYTLGLLVLYGLLQGQDWKEVLDSVKPQAVLFSDVDDAQDHLSAATTPFGSRVPVLECIVNVRALDGASVCVDLDRSEDSSIEPVPLSLGWISSSKKLFSTS